MRKAIAWFAENYVAANLLMMFLVLAGIFTLFSIKIEVFPETSLDKISITTEYPGASPSEVEEAVTCRIEEQVAGLSGIKRIDSTSYEGVSVVIVEVIKGWDVQELLDEVKAEVARIVTFPDEAEEPIIREIVQRIEVIHVVLYGDVPDTTLKFLAEKIKDDITNLPGVTSAEVVGVLDAEVHIEISEETLRRYGLTLGQVADMDPILTIAKKHGLAVIEDAAQAIGAGYKDKKAGAIGDLGCFSFYPSKNLGGIGDGGMVIVSREDYRDMMKMLRVHGWTRKYDPDVVGYNSRLATIQAAALCVKLDYLAGWSEVRRAHAARYDAAFAGTKITTPVAKDYAYHIYNQYTIAVENRDELMAALQEKNIGYDIYYPIPFHQLTCYAELRYKAGDFPESERASSRVVSIPVFPELTEAEQDEVIAVIKAVSA